MSEFYDSLLKTVSQSDRDFFVYYEERRSYAEMHRIMLKINSALSRHRNKRIALYALKGYATYSAIFAILLSGNAWVPVNPQMPDARNADMIGRAEPVIILTDRELPKEITDYAAKTGAEVISLMDLIDGEESAPFDVSAIDEDDEAIVFFTSGSSGEPKGVPLVHANFTGTVRNVLDQVPFVKGEVFADYHDLGFVLCIPYLFCCIFTESAFAPGIEEQERLIPLNSLDKNKVTVLVTVPSTISRLRSLRKNGIDGHSIRILCLAGEPFHLDILDYCFNKLGVGNVFDFYGSTEVGCWIFSHTCAPEDLENYADIGFVPIGKPMPGNIMRIGDQEELLMSGPQITPGYLGGIEAQKFTVADGVRWFATGDKVIERDGVYFCKGRLDSQVKISGHRIELMDTEAHLRKIDGVEHAVCFVAARGGRDMIVAGLLSTCDVGIDEVREDLSKRLPDYMIPRKVFRIETMPLNKSGKVDRIVVRAMFDKLNG